MISPFTRVIHRELARSGSIIRLVQLYEWVLIEIYMKRLYERTVRLRFQLDLGQHNNLQGE